MAVSLNWRDAIETHLMRRLITESYVTSWRYPNRRGVEWPGTRGETLEFTDVVIAAEDAAFTGEFIEGLATLYKTLHRGDREGMHLHLILWGGLGAADMVNAVKELRLVVRKLLKRGTHRLPLPVLCVGTNYDEGISKTLENALINELTRVRGELLEVVPSELATLAVGIVNSDSLKLQAILRSSGWDLILVTR